MIEHMKKEEESIAMNDQEYALRALNDQEFRQSEEFAAWLCQEPHRVLFREMMDSREALINLCPAMTPDTDKAWERIRPLTRISSFRKHALWITGTAAAIALLITGYFLLPTTEMPQPLAIAILPAIDRAQEITLSTEDGLTVTIDGAQSKQLIAEAGAKLDNEALNYEHTPSEETVRIHTLSTPRGKNFKVILDDGTEVWLNAESKLRYPDHFTGKERKVELEGEAFFHVTKDASRPFIVKNGTTETRVLGTEFNFRAYPFEGRHVTLISGSVIVADPQKENQLKLAPGQDVSLDENGQQLIACEVDLNEFTAWKEDLFCFKEAALIDIMKSVGRWYNLTVVFMDKASMNYHFNFWADRNDSPEGVIKLLNQVGKVKATIENSQIIINKP